MKRSITISILTIILMILCLSGCQQEKEPASEPVTKPQVEEQKKTDLDILIEHIGNYEGRPKDFRGALKHIGSYDYQSYVEVCDLVDAIIEIQDGIDSVKLGSVPLNDDKKVRTSYRENVEKLRGRVRTIGYPYTRLIKEERLLEAEVMIENINGRTPAGNMMVAIEGLDPKSKKYEKRLAEIKAGYETLNDMEKSQVINYYKVKKAALKRVVRVHSEMVGKGYMHITWDAVSDAEGYDILRYDKKSDRYTVIGSIDAADENNYLGDGMVRLSYVDDSKLDSARKYTYKVRAYVEYDGKKYTGKKSKGAEVMSRPGKVKGLSAEKKDGRVTVTWKKVSRATGYKVYRAAKEDGDFECIGFLDGRDSLEYKVAATKDKCWYKVRAYKEYKGKKIYGLYSKAVKAE